MPSTARKRGFFKMGDLVILISAKTGTFFILISAIDRPDGDTTDVQCNQPPPSQHKPLRCCCTHPSVGRHFQFKYRKLDFCENSALTSLISELNTSTRARSQPIFGSRTCYA